MQRTRDFDKRYRTGDLPWDTGRHDRNLELVIREYGIAPCTVLELGAGTGTDAIWLARKGFRVTAVDLSPTAVGMARKKASAAGVEVEFIVADILRDELPPGPFGFVFDRGCFHTFDLPEERARLAETVWRRLGPGGHWFSLMGSADGPEREEGPPRRSALDIVSAVEPWFEILLLRSTRFDSKLPEAPRSWACLMRKRDRVSTAPHTGECRDTE
ncbi:MAG: class I SAM-dependent methyltransferase [Deferribacteres bacterium]|nr:class I SAM-dependent methyltransferase [Deferribacteres bacterium]